MTRHGVRGFLVLALLVATASWIACGLTDKDPQASEIKLVINELVSNGANDEPDWIELKRPGQANKDTAVQSIT